jgi:hypothetical protein
MNAGLGMARISQRELRSFQEMSAEAVILRLADYAKRDPHFSPIKNKHTSRWYVTARGREFELLLNGPKFYDMRQKSGGGGAIDLAMHLLCLDFKAAIETLRSTGQEAHGGQKSTVPTGLPAMGDRTMDS